MAIMTTINFILKGWALLVLDRRPKRYSLSQAQFLSVITLFTPLVALLGYIFGVRDVRGAGPFLLLGVMAVPMGIAWIALSVGTLFARPSFGFMRVLTESGSASYALRTLLIPAILVPVALSLVFVYGVHHLFYIPSFGVAVFSTVGILILASLIWRTVSGLSTLEAKEKRAIVARKRSELSLSAMFDLVPSGMVFVNTETGQFIKVNQRLCQMTGYTEQELLHMTFRNLTHPEDDISQWPEYQRMVSSGSGQFHFEKRYIRKDGTTIWVDVMGFVIGEIAGTSVNVAIIQDLTLRKAEETTLQRAKDSAEAANQLKSSFLANMSHELRTPLGVITGFTELAERSDVSPADRQIYLATIKRNSHILKKMIDEVLDLAKVESGKLNVEKVQVALHKFFSDFMIDFQPLAQKNKNDLTIKVDGVVPESIYTDPSRLRQVLVNIVGNAVKFTRGGKVSLIVHLGPERGPKENGTLRITVSDTGPGVPEDQRAKLFQPFSQVDNSMTRKYGGTGLGLVLAKKLAQALGGDIELTESEVGKGSTFTITVDTGPLSGVPLVKKIEFTNGEVMAPKNRLDKDLEGVAILLAEDSEEIRFLVETLLTSHGATITTVSNGKEAVQAASLRDYDVVLMDLQMPELDGYEATKQLREREYSKPIIALSASAMREEYSRALDAGCNAHLTKPFKHRDLVETILHYSGPQRYESQVTDLHP